MKKEEAVEAMFPGRIYCNRDIEKSTLSDKVYATVVSEKCVDIHDRATPLDYWVCVLAFVFDLNFKESYEIIKKSGYINILIDRFAYSDVETKARMEKIRNTLNDFVDRHVYRY